MDFDLTGEQVLLQTEISDFIGRELPGDRVREFDENKEFPHEIWRKMAELGWLALPFDEKYGGANRTTLEMVLVIEKLAQRMPALAVAYITTVLYADKVIGLFGSEVQKKFYLPKVARGEALLTNCLTEPSGGTDLLSLSTSASRVGDDYVINGQKVFSTGAHLASYLIVTARTTKLEDVQKRSMGISLFIVDAKTPGIDIRPLACLGHASDSPCEVFYTDVRVQQENLVGEAGKGWYHILRFVDCDQITVAAQSLGYAQAAFNIALQYAKERYAFGKPIGQFQAIQHYIADMAISIELARNITYKAAWLDSMGRSCTNEATMARIAASNTGFEVTSKAMRILGGYGYVSDNEIQRYFRDAVAWICVPSHEMGRNVIGESFGLPRSY